MQPSSETSATPDNSVHTVEKASQLAGNGKFQIIILVVAGIASMCMVMENMTMAFALPMAKCDLKLSTSEEGFLRSVIFIGVLASSHFWGFITDTWGRIRTLRLTLLFTCIVSTISSFSWNTTMLSVTRLMVGLSTSGIKISSIVYMSEFFDNSHRAKYFALFSSLLTAASIVQPLLGLAILTSDFEYNWFDGFSYRPWRLFMLCVSQIAGLTCIACFFLPEGPAFLLAIGKHKDALKVLQTVYHMNSGQPRENYEVKKLEMDSENSSNLTRVKNVKEAFSLLWNQTWPLFVAPYRTNMIVLCFLMFFTFAAAQGLHLWYPQILLFFEDRSHLSFTTCQTIMQGQQILSLMKPIINSTLLALNATLTPQDECSVSFDISTMTVTILLGLVMVSLNLVVAFLFKFIGKTNAITTWFACNTIGAIGLIWAMNYYVIMILMIFLLSTIALINCYVALASDIFETKYKGMATGLLIMSGRIGSLVGSNLIASMIYTSCDSLFKMIAATLIGCTCVAYYILRKTSEVSETKTQS